MGGRCSRIFQVRALCSRLFGISPDARQRLPRAARHNVEKVYRGYESATLDAAGVTARPVTRVSEPVEGAVKLALEATL
jgi:hypothetical protein